MGICRRRCRADFLIFQGLFLFALIDAGANGELSFGEWCGSVVGTSSPEGKWVWAAKDEDAFRILQSLRHGSVEGAAGNRTASERQNLAARGWNPRRRQSRTLFCRVEISAGFAEQEHLQRVLKVKSGYAEGQVVFVSASCAQFRVFI